MCTSQVTESCARYDNVLYSRTVTKVLDDKEGEQKPKEWNEHGGDASGGSAPSAGEGSISGGGEKPPSSDDKNATANTGKER